MYVPSHVNEASDPVDNLGGILSVVLVAALVLSINFAPVPDKGMLCARARSHRCRGLDRVPAPPAPRVGTRSTTSTSPVAASSGSPPSAGMIVFGTLMGAMFVGQQFLQNVLGYSTLEAGAVDPARGRLHGAGRAALRQARRSARRPVHAPDRLRLLPARLPRDAAALERGHLVLEVGLAYALVGVGVGFAGTPASHSLTSSVPVRRAGMASGTADLQRDLGGAIMQSILGALLTAGYAAAVAAAIATAPNKEQITDGVASQLTKSFASAEAIAAQYPQYASQITAGAKRRSSTVRIGPTPPASSPSCSAQSWSSSCSRRRTRRSGCSPPTTRRTPSA